ncbi:MAG TPA: aldose 1-epimerase [Verrucomicrobiae bacterium]|nr:aldose 1-epimerase [Verrucomicrobiae bacterium]
MELITLEVQGERAVIVPEAGCQCLSYRAGSIDVVAGPADPSSWREHPHRGGIPILFPWPGRVAGARFTFNGREYRMPVNEPARGHSIHGFASERAFRVTRRGPYFVTAILDSNDYSDLSSIWPWPFKLEIDYEVGNGLRLKARVTNTGNSVMPFGFGAHPYFHAPLDPKGSRDAMMVQLDADLRWQLDASLIPTGTLEPLAGKYDLRAPRPLETDTYDDAFHMAPTSNGDRPRARLIDPSLKVALEVRADSAFEDFVVYAPPDNAVVALEPYTSAPDAFNLAARGVAAGMRELAPGQTFEAGFEIRLSAP